MSTEARIRSLKAGDANVIATAFTDIGWHKPASQFLLYLAEQATGRRVVLVATVASAFAGYVTLVWEPNYPYFRQRTIPEVQDLNVLPLYRRRGIATQLVGLAERIASDRAAMIGIGVGLHPGYNAAQRMYALRGYAPDAQGVAYDGRYVVEGEQVAFDDRLVLYFTKKLR